MRLVLGMIYSFIKKSSDFATILYICIFWFIFPENKGNDVFTNMLTLSFG